MWSTKLVLTIILLAAVLPGCAGTQTRPTPAELLEADLGPSPQQYERIGLEWAAQTFVDIHDAKQLAISKPQKDWIAEEIMDGYVVDGHFAWRIDLRPRADAIYRTGSRSDFSNDLLDSALQARGWPWSIWIRDDQVIADRILGRESHRANSEGIVLYGEWSSELAELVTEPDLADRRASSTTQHVEENQRIETVRSALAEDILTFPIWPESSRRTTARLARDDVDAALTTIQNEYASRSERDDARAVILDAYNAVLRTKSAARDEEERQQQIAASTGNSQAR